MGPWPNNFPNFPANFAAVHQIPRFPVPAAGIEQTGGGPIGIFVDGVAMFDSRDAFSFNQTNAVDATPMNGLTGDRIWNRDAYVNEGDTFDPAMACRACTQPRSQ